MIVTQQVKRQRQQSSASNNSSNNSSSCVNNLTSPTAQASLKKTEEISEATNGLETSNLDAETNYDQNTSLVIITNKKSENKKNKKKFGFNAKKRLKVNDEPPVPTDDEAESLAGDASQASSRKSPAKQSAVAISHVNSLSHKSPKSLVKQEHEDKREEMMVQDNIEVNCVEKQAADEQPEQKIDIDDLSDASSTR